LHFSRTPSYDSVPFRPLVLCRHLPYFPSDAGNLGLEVQIFFFANRLKAVFTTPSCRYLCPLRARRLLLLRLYDTCFRKPVRPSILDIFFPPDTFPSRGYVLVSPLKTVSPSTAFPWKALAESDSLIMSFIALFLKPVDFSLSFVNFPSVLFLLKFGVRHPFLSFFIVCVFWFSILVYTRFLTRLSA